MRVRHERYGLRAPILFGPALAGFIPFRFRSLWPGDGSTSPFGWRRAARPRGPAQRRLECARLRVGRVSRVRDATKTGPTGVRSVMPGTRAPIFLLEWGTTSHRRGLHRTRALIIFGDEPYRNINACGQCITDEFTRYTEPPLLGVRHSRAGDTAGPVAFMRDLSARGRMFHGAISEKCEK